VQDQPKSFAKIELVSKPVEIIQQEELKIIPESVSQDLKSFYQCVTTMN
jgi:hypothetical protein